ncbi:tegument protein [Psittacid alphaherpesvirus 5]|nr:tegument protein [Psittacid alphaherpesvirus 5]
MNGTKTDRKRLRDQMMNYVRCNAYKKNVIDMSRAGISMTHPSFLYAFTKARTEEELLNIRLTSERRITDARKYADIVETCLSTQKDLKYELENHRRYTSEGFLHALDKTRARLDDVESELKYVCDEALEQECLTNSSLPNSSEEADILLRWELELMGKRDINHIDMSKGLPSFNPRFLDAANTASNHQTTSTLPN